MDPNARGTLQKQWFVKGTFESPKKNATRVAEYPHFAIYNHVIRDGPVDLSSEVF